MKRIKIIYIYFNLLEVKKNGSKDSFEENGCIEQVGTYNPMVDPSVTEFDAEKVQKWIKNGAQPTDTVKRLLKEKGII